MPRVPDYSDPQVAPRPLQAPTIAPPLAGAEQMQRAGQAIEGAGERAAQIALDMQDRENADAIFKAETAIKNDYLDFENGARQRRGENAKGVAKDAADWWAENGAKYTDGLANDAQKRFFGQTVAKLRQQSIAGLSAYEAGERRKALEESAQGSIVGSINLAAGQVGTPTEGAAISGAKNDILKRLAVLRQLNGWDENFYTTKQAEALTNLHTQVIQNKIRTAPDAARAYFELNKGEINGTQYDAIEKALKIGTSLQAAQSIADELQVKGVDEAEGLKVIREKLSGEDEHAAVAEWKTRMGEAAAIREKQQRDAADTAWGIFARSGRISAIPADVLSKLDGKVLIALQHEARGLAEGKEPKTDSEVYYGLRQLAVNDPETFRKTDLRQFFPNLSRADREEFIKLQTKPDEIKDAATLDAQLSNMHDQLGWGAGDRKKKGDFDRVVTNAINEEARKRGKPLNYDERQKLIDRFVVEGKVEGAGFLGLGGTQRYFEAVQGAKADTFTPTVPKEERQKIEAALKRAGKPVTDEEVARLYRKKVGL